MPRGGRRPGAGAPPGNMNAMKHGAYSRQFAQVGALLAQHPTIRQDLLGLARKHNLKQQRANEVAALLFTRLFERAETIAAHRSALLKPRTSNLKTGLNLDIDDDDLDSIKQAAARAAVRQIRSALKNAGEKEKQPHPNQTADTKRGGQS